MEKCISNIHTSSICIRHGLIQFKVFHRLHYSNDRLAKIYLSVLPTCPRCGNQVSLGHMFQSCPSLVNSWSSIFDCLSVLCNTPLKPNPLIALFGVTPSEIYTTNKQKRAIAFCSLITRRVILMNWKSNKCPPFRRWIQVLSLLQLEKIRHTLNGSCDAYTRVWSPFIDYVKKFIV